MPTHPVPIEVSARHLHLSQRDCGEIFGNAYQLHEQKKISQPDQFAAAETVIVTGPKGKFPHVRIIGPLRPESQFELSVTDCIHLGIVPYVALSGELKGSPGGVTVIGPAGQITLTRGVIVAQRHLHCNELQAVRWGLRHLQTVSIRVNGIRGLIFNDVVVRSRAGVDELSFMIDTDEANAAGVRQGDQGELLLGNSV